MIVEVNLFRNRSARKEEAKCDRHGTAGFTGTSARPRAVGQESVVASETSWRRWLRDMKWIGELSLHTVTPDLMQLRGKHFASQQGRSCANYSQRPGKLKDQFPRIQCYESNVVVELIPVLGREPGSEAREYLALELFRTGVARQG